MNEQTTVDRGKYLTCKNAHATYAEGEARPDFTRSYYAPKGGLPGQNELMSGRSVFTESYAFIPRGVMTDIVTSGLPFWDKTRAWIIARRMSGFAETFSQYIMEVEPGGGSMRPDTEEMVGSALFTVEGEQPGDDRGRDLPAHAGAFRVYPPRHDLDPAQPPPPPSSAPSCPSTCRTR